MTLRPQNGFGVFFRIFFAGGEMAFLLGVLQILVEKTWFLDGNSW
jgi:hypothetical protein